MSCRLAHGVQSGTGIRKIPESSPKSKVGTTVSFLCTRRWAGLPCFIALVLLCSLCLSAPIPGWAQSAVPEFAAGSHHLYLVPYQDSQGLDFLTHIAEVHVQQESPSSTTFSTVATYRWHNTQAEARNLELLVRSRAGPISHPAPGQLQSWTVRRNNVALPLTPLANGQYLTTVHLDPDQRLTLELHYTVQAPARYFPRIAYDTTLLRRWQNAPDSMRVSIFPGFAPQAGNVLLPSTTDYELRADEVRWLYENSLPARTPEARLLQKDIWESIQAAIRNQDYITQGQHYYSLYVAADAPASHRRMYYDQALAAFLQALDQNPGPAHYGLARLYRLHSLSGSTAKQDQYLELTLHHAQLALQTLDPSATVQRQEVKHWLWQSLEMRVRLSTLYADWATVYQALETIAALPVDDIDDARLENLQYYIQMQEAIQLLEQGMTDQALQLAGPTILDPYFMPAAQQAALFTGWHADIRIGPDSFTAHMEGTLDTRQRDRMADAVTELEALLAQGEPGVQTKLVLTDAGSSPGSVTADPVLVLDLHITNPNHARALAEVLPANSEWLLVRHLLQESWLHMTQTRSPLFVEQVYEFTLDLSELYRFWHTKALALEEIAVTEASAGANSQQEVIRQMNFLNAADDWRQLAQNTTVLVALENAPGRTDATARWTATEDQPAVQIRSTARSLRMLPLVLFSVLGLLLAAGSSLLLIRLPLHPLQSTRLSSPS